jgi:hypothetical protein
MPVQFKVYRGRNVQYSKVYNEIFKTKRELELLTNKCFNINNQLKTQDIVTHENLSVRQLQPSRVPLY